MTLTEEQRDELACELCRLSEVEKPIRDLMEPLRKALDRLDAVREMTLLRYELTDEPQKCECGAILLPGDLVHFAEDCTLCADCAPTWNDIVAELEECAAGETPPDDDVKHGLALARAHVKAGEGDKKNAWPLR